MIGKEILGYSNFEMKLSKHKTENRVIKEPKIKGWQKQQNIKSIIFGDKAIKHCVVACGAINNFLVIDFDLMSSYIAFTEKYKFLKNSFIEKSPRGYHIYIQYDERFKSGTNVMSNFKNIDVLSDGKICICYPTTYTFENKKYEYKIIENKPILKLNEEQIKLLLSEYKPDKLIKNKIVDKIETPIKNKPENMEIIEKMAELIDITYINNYQDYFKLVRAFSYLGLYDLSIKTCSKSEKFDIENHDMIFNYNYSQNLITGGTIYHYAKISNFEEYIKLLPSPPKLDNNDASLSDLFIYFEKDNLVILDGTLYLYHNQLWKKDDNLIIKKHLRDVLNKYVCYRIKKHQDVILSCSEDERKDKIKYSEELNKILYRLTVKKNLDCIIELTKQTLAFESMDKKIIFDTGEEQKYNIHFQNGVYELDNKRFRPRVQSDYITKFLDWNYQEEVEQDKIDFVFDMFKKSQPDEQQRKFTLSWLAYCLNGNTGLQKSKFNIGYKGSNGKSNELKVHSKIFNIYSFKLDNKSFNNTFTKQHKQFIHLINNPIRLAYIEELDRKELNVDLLKDFIDGDTLNVEIMYGTSVQKDFQAALTACSNKDFNLKIDGGMARRGTVQYYNSQFKNVEKNDYEKHIYKRIDNFDKIFDNEDYKNAYFKLLLQYYSTDTFIPKENEELFKNIALDQDSFKLYFDEIFQETNDMNDMIHKNEALEAFNVRVGSKSRRNWSSFLGEMKRLDIEFDRLKYKNSKRGYFIGIKFKEDEDEYDKYSNDLDK